jgi:hypothetical protein
MRPVSVLNHQSNMLSPETSSLEGSTEDICSSCS